MAAVKAPSHVIDQLKNATGLVELAVSESIELTPVLVLAVSLLYMMSSDGRIEEEESSQLQAVIGGNEALLSYAVAYVQRVPVDDFLEQAASVLSTQDKLCILCNVCDSMLSDGRSEQTELEFFDKLQTAFGVATAVFRPYFKAIELKNGKTVLGPFDAIHGVTSQITPHLALAASLLYMMSADGSLGQEEIGQLETVIGEFDGLQKAALAYVREVKREEFFKQVAPVLTKAQKLCILANVCDSMMSDGVVAVVEDKLFLSMMSAFGIQVAEFDEFHKVLETKNFKPFDTSKFENRTSHARSAGASNTEGEIFDMTKDDSELGIEVRRTMHDNIERVQHDFGSDTNVIQVNHNAIDDLNIQKIDAKSAVGLNIQTLSTGDTSTNRQPVDTQAVTQTGPQWISGRTDKDNKQKLTAHASGTSRVPVAPASVVANLQNIGEAVVDVNRQVLDAPATDKHLEFLPTEERVKNLFEDIEVLTQQLDDFEARHKKILLAGQQARVRQEAQKKAMKGSQDSALLPLPQEALLESRAGAKAAVSLNIQSVGADLFQQHRERLSNPESLADASLASSTLNTNGLETDQVTELDMAQNIPFDVPTSSSGVATSQATARRRTRGRGVTQVLGLRWDWRAYLKMAMTFIVLSCWTCNIAAIHLEHKNIATGKLVRLVEFRL